MEVEIKINKYINDELSGLELEAFEALLTNDKALQKQVQFHKEVDKALAVNEEVEENKNLKSLLNDLGKTHIQNIGKKKPKMETEKERVKNIANPELLPENKGKLKLLKPFLLLAAAATFLLFMFLPSLKNQSNTTLADKHFQPYQFYDNVLGKENDEDLLKEANEKYTNENWKGANQLLEKYLETKPKIPNAWLAKGCAEFKLTKFDAAIESFSQVLVIDKGKIYHSTAHWYLALCYLKKDENEKATTALKHITKGQDYFNNAQQLLKRIQ